MDLGKRKKLGKKPSFTKILAVSEFSRTSHYTSETVEKQHTSFMKL